MRAHAAALGAVSGALLALGLPLWAWAAVAVVALLRRTPLLIGLAMLLVAGTLASAAAERFEPAEPGRFEGWATLLDDPRRSGPYSVRATARVGAERMALSAHGPAAGRLDDRLSGERVWVTGTTRAVDPDDEWARWRHITGRLSVATVGDHLPGSPITRAANAVRRLLSGGAQALPDEQRALLLGMVIGDDRDQTPVVADDFRAAGLGHLLVVSGQNVAFVMGMVAPLLAWARPGVRLVLLAALLVFFAVLTRFEPSVLRAVTMAAVGVGGLALGHPVSGRRALSVAVAALVCVDPFLVRVLAFQLSAAATAAIVWLSVPIAERLIGPAPLRIAVSTTVAAQLGVAPLLLATFGPMPLATLPANLLAGPLSGPVMVWGSSAGLLAGVLGGWPAVLIHVPTRLMLSWIAGVASASAAAPQAQLGAGAVVIVAAAILLVVLSRRRWAGLLAVAALALVLTASFRAAPSLGPGVTGLDAGATAHRVGDAVVVVLDDPRRPRELLEGMRLAGVRRVDLVVAADGDLADALAVIALADRYHTVVVAPALHRVPAARSVVVGDRLRAGDAEVTVVSDVDGLVVDVRAAP